MSLGYTTPSAAVRSALQYALSRGVVPVASSGNSGDNDTQHGKAGSGMAPESFPADYPGVLGVGAVLDGPIDRTRHGAVAADTRASVTQRSS